MKLSAKLPPLPPLTGALSSDTGAGRSMRAAEATGEKARRLFDELNLFRTPRYPPWRVARYRPFQHAIALLAMVYLLPVAGLPARRVTGKPLIVQAAEMLRLWFQQRVDPPSYYAQELYETARMPLVKGYLTRFETKNGLFASLNRARPSPFQRHELNDKDFFAEFCTTQGLPHARTLARISPGTCEWFLPREEITHDLFCKPQKGLGAKGTAVFRAAGPDQFINEAGEVITLAGVEKALQGMGTTMLVQRRLTNHPAIADMARDSLLTVRVITCRNERDEPEVCLAMLRLLAVLERDRSDLPDGEYATPIQLETGVLGMLAGDDMKSSPFRSAVHPATGRVIAGRVLPEWDAVKALALKLHGALPHRVVVGWDIAVTPDGPVVLEGNSNFDVMFLQRVQHVPASETRFGELLSYHLEALARQRRGGEKA
ncbi:sugar-transfer associated ATP-grasp domain-containing protein [Aestuariivirga sp.]|uniref:sugar-transfer associated ATP-grasp domain-containing protein n=1 Tax=Aestuariivirga sp. TaxID=2650926 RepID=UPI0039E5625A